MGEKLRYIHYTVSNPHFYHKRILLTSVTAELRRSKLHFLCLDTLSPPGIGLRQRVGIGYREFGKVSTRLVLCGQPAGSGALYCTTCNASMTTNKRGDEKTEQKLPSLVQQIRSLGAPMRWRDQTATQIFRGRAIMVMPAKKDRELPRKKRL